MSHEPRSYYLATAFLRRAEAAGARVEVGSRGAMRLVGGDEAMLAAYRSLAGTLEPTPPNAAELAAALPEGFRLLPDGRLINLRCPTRLALARICAAPHRNAAEALVVPVVAFRGLPAAVSVHLARKGRPFTVAGAKSAYTAAVERGEPVWAWREVEALALAVEVERAYPTHLDRWLEAKARGGWALSLEASGALDVMGVTADRRSALSLGELLDGLEVELVDVVVHETKGGPT